MMPSAKPKAIAMPYGPSCSRASITATTVRLVPNNRDDLVFVLMVVFLIVATILVVSSAVTGVPAP